MSGIGIILLLIVLSGFIAYLGDRIGMKAGKKRISIFGLRPRYSSIIITIVTGILIAGLSITILLVTYSSLRQALLNINDVLNRLEMLNRQLEQKDQELGDMKTEIDTKAGELEQLQREKGNLEDELASTKEEYNQAQENLQQARQDIKSLEENRRHLQDKVSSLEDQRQQLEEERQRLEEEISSLNQKIESLTEDYREVEELAKQYQTGMMYYMGGDIVYQKGDVIYSDVLQGGQSEQETIAALNDFLDRANRRVKQRPIKVDEDSGMALRLQTEDILNAARIIYNMDKEQKVIVSLVARVNVPKNDWVLANFLLNKDFKVFEEGELITSQVIDADQSPDQLEGKLEQLLETVNNQAVDKGLLADHQGQVGSIDFSQFYQLLNRIQSREGQVKVEVFATRDIWRVDRLGSNIKFSLKQVEQEQEE